MADIFVELRPGARAMAHLQALGAEPLFHYANISALMGTEIWSYTVQAGVPLRPFLSVPGVIYVEPNEEHSYADVIFERRPLRWRDTEPFGTKFIALPTVQGPEASQRSTLSQILALAGFGPAWEWSTGQGAVIVVGDSGIDGSRIPPEKRAGGWAGLPGDDPWTDEFGHGTGSALTALAAAPGAKIFSAKFPTGPEGGMTKTSVMGAVDALIPLVLENPDVPFIMNSSWASDCVRAPYHCNMIPARMVRAIDRANAVTMVWAAGNDNLDCGGAPSITCIESNPGAIAVAALDSALQPHPYSARGPGYCSPLQPLVGAATYGVLPWGRGWIDTGSQGAGTSSTAPQVSGALAILRAKYPRASNVALRAALVIGARPVQDTPGWNPAAGFGLLQADAALNALETVPGHPYYQIVAASALAGPAPTIIHPAARAF